MLACSLSLSLSLLKAEKQPKRRTEQRQLVMEEEEERQKLNYVSKLEIICPHGCHRVQLRWRNTGGLFICLCFKALEGLWEMLPLEGQRNVCVYFRLAQPAYVAWVPNRARKGFCLLLCDKIRERGGGERKTERKKEKGKERKEGNKGTKKRIGKCY